MFEQIKEDDIFLVTPPPNFPDFFIVYVWDLGNGFNGNMKTNKHSFKFSLGILWIKVMSRIIEMCL